MPEDIASLKQGLIEAISPYINDQIILDAFRRISRHEFVEVFFDWEKELESGNWQIIMILGGSKKYIRIGRS